MYEKDRGIEETESIDSEHDTPSVKKRRPSMKGESLGGGVSNSRAGGTPGHEMLSPGGGNVPNHQLIAASQASLMKKHSDEKRLQAINGIMLKSLLYSNLPISLIQSNPYLIEWLSASGGGYSSSSLNDLTKLTNEGFDYLYNEAESLKYEFIAKSSFITLSCFKVFDDSHANYAFVVFANSSSNSSNSSSISSTSSSYRFLGISTYQNIDLTNSTYLSEWFLTEILNKYFIHSKDPSSSSNNNGHNGGNTFDYSKKIIALLCDSSNDFHQLITDITKYHPSIIHIPTILHSLNAILQEISKIPTIHNVIKRNCSILYSLITSPYWKTILDDFNLSSLPFFSNPSSYLKCLLNPYGNLYELCMIISILEIPIKDIYHGLHNKINKYSLNVNPNEVKALLQYENYFNINNEIIILFKPIVDIIRYIERKEGKGRERGERTAAEEGGRGEGGGLEDGGPLTVGHIYSFFLTIHYHLENIEISTITNTSSFQLKHCIETIKNILFKRLLIYSSSSNLFSISFYLNPNSKNILFKQRYTNASQIHSQIMELYHIWNGGKQQQQQQQGGLTGNELESYHNSNNYIFNFTNEEKMMNPAILWKNRSSSIVQQQQGQIPEGSSSLIYFANQLFSIPITTLANEIHLENDCGISLIKNQNDLFLYPSGLQFFTPVMLSPNSYMKLNQFVSVLSSVHLNIPFPPVISSSSSSSTAAAVVGNKGVTKDFNSFLTKFSSSKSLDELENDLLLDTTSYFLQNKINKDSKLYSKGMNQFFNVDLFKNIYENEVVQIGHENNNNSNINNSLSQVISSSSSSASTSAATVPISSSSFSSASSIPSSGDNKDWSFSNFFFREK
jgi:hypothetical protein